MISFRATPFAAEEIEDLTHENKRLAAQVKADRRLREQHTSLLSKSKAAREQAAAHAARAAALDEELAQLNAKVRVNTTQLIRPRRPCWSRTVQPKKPADISCLTRGTTCALVLRHTTSAA